MRRSAMSSLLMILLVLLGLNVLMFIQQHGMVFIPYHALEATPKSWGLDYQDVTLRTQDGLSLHAWYVPHAQARQTLLFFHGNAGNISHRRESIEIFHALGLNVLIIDYRGYGGSEGTPSEAGLYMDARAAWTYLITERGQRAGDIVLFGRSLGAAVASRLATEVQPRALVLESCFSSARDVARKVFPILSRVVYQRFNFNTADNVKHVSSPLLVLHSPEDEIIPFELGNKVYLAAGEPKRFVELKGDHNTGFLRSRPAYEQAIKAFLDEHPAR